MRAVGRLRRLPGAVLTADDYLAAQPHRARLCAEVHAVMDSVGLLLAANMLDPACRIADPVPLAHTSERQARTTFNVTGHPALSIPTGLSTRGLPLSAQLVGPMHAEATLLQVCAALERAGRGIATSPCSLTDLGD